jgi:pimeloyl-ACP methyl ester carboxylesterase
MPYVNSQDVRIHYQVEGEGPPLVLQHGFTDSLESWYEFGYVDALKPDHTLILVDARGHGQSDKPHDPDAYDLVCFTADIVAVLNALTFPKACFFGYSMGGRIRFGMARYAADRVHALILGGNHPYQPRSATADPTIEVLQQGPEAVPSIWTAALSPSLQARLVQNDVEALVAFRRKRGTFPSHEAILPTMTMPCLLFAGEADPNYAGVKECVQHMPNATCFFLPGLTHAETFFRSDLVLPHLTQFLATVPA